jgi:hypothetical protein
LHAHATDTQQVLHTYQATRPPVRGLVVTSNEMSFACLFDGALRIFRLPEQRAFASAASIASTASTGRTASTASTNRTARAAGTLQRHKRTH